jgi:hypothetical protein
MKTLNELMTIAREAGDTRGSSHPPCEWFLGPEGMYIFAKDKSCKRGECLDIVCEPRGVASKMIKRYIEHITTFDPRTVWLLLDRLRKSEQAVVAGNAALAISQAANTALREELKKAEDFEHEVASLKEQLDALVVKFEECPRAADAEVKAVRERLEKQRRRALAAEAMVEAYTDEKVAVCVECGIVTSCDEDRCCATCGRDLIVCADGHSADMLVEYTVNAL